MWPIMANIMVVRYSLPFRRQKAVGKQDFHYQVESMVIEP
jgi:hypothetical protein